MNALDLAIIATAIGAGFGGWRLGLVARVFAWAGVFAGLAIGVNFVPKVVTGLGGNSADDRIGVALLFLVLVASIGQAFGLMVGLLVHRVFPIANPLPLWDRIAGATAGVLGLLVLVWMVIPSLATAQGWPARMARDSWMVAAIERVAPSQPAQFAAWGLAISEAPYPSALDPLATPPDPGTVPTTTLAPAVDARVRRSIVKVTGEACNQIQDGSGWVAAPGIVVTNAHVVAGERIDDRRSTTPGVTSTRGRRRVRSGARPRGAVRSRTRRAAPLPLADGHVGDDGAVYGHPGGGPLQAAPARIGEEIVAVGTNIYRTSTSRRHVYVLASRLAPGDSGGALVNRSGDVVGVAFAIDPGRSGTSYALTNEEVEPDARRGDARQPRWPTRVRAWSSRRHGCGSCLLGRIRTCGARWRSRLRSTADSRELPTHPSGCSGRRIMRGLRDSRGDHESARAGARNSGVRSEGAAQAEDARRSQAQLANRERQRAAQLRLRPRKSRPTIQLR